MSIDEELRAHIDGCAVCRRLLRNLPRAEDLIEADAWARTAREHLSRWHRGVMADVETTHHHPTEPGAGTLMEEIRVKLKAELAYDLVGIVCNGPDGVVVLRAPGIPIGFSEAVLQAMEDRGYMKLVDQPGPS